MPYRIVKRNPSSPEKEIILEVDPVGGGGSIKTYSVKGKVKDSSGTGIPDRTVILYDTVKTLNEDWGDSVPLHWTVTDENGDYLIYYTTAELQVNDPEKLFGDIQLKVFDISPVPSEASPIDLNTPATAGLPETAEAESEIYIDALAHEEIDIIVASEPISIEPVSKEITDKISPHISGEVRLLTSRQLDIVASKSRISRRSADMIKKAEQLAQLLTITRPNASEPFVTISSPTYELKDVLFGLLANGIPHDVVKFLSTSKWRKERAFREALRNRLIDWKYGKRIAGEYEYGILDDLHQPQKVEILKRVTEGEDPGPPVQAITIEEYNTLGHLLIYGVGLTVEKAEQFFIYYQENAGQPDFWSGVTGLSTSEESDVRDILMLHELVRNNPNRVVVNPNPLEEKTLAQELLNRIKDTGITTITSVEDFVTYPVGEASGDPATATANSWLELVGEFGSPSEANLAVDSADALTEARRLFNTFQVAFPERAFAEDIASSTASADIKKFFENNNAIDPEEDRFDFLSSPSAFFVQHNQADPITDGVFLGISEANIPAVKEKVHEYTRVWMLLEDPDILLKADALIESGFDSATKIVRRGKKAFEEQAVSLVGPLPDEISLFDNAEASRVYSRAVRQMLTAQSLRGLLSQSLNTPGTMVVPALPSPDSVNYPELTAVFGTVDYCNCEHCQSSQSPAAYLVDVLEFVRSAKNLKTGENPAWDQLIARRPEFANLLASCQNTNTLIPYIDLVNEVLEQAIQELNSQPGLTDRQTTQDRDQIKVFPEHIQSEVYDNFISDFSHLSAQEQLDDTNKVSWDLPFHLWNSEVASYLDLKGINRGTLIRITEGNLNTDAVISTSEAQVTLGLSDGLKTTITDANWTKYFSSTVDSNSFNSVEDIIARSELSYEELLETLDSAFVNFNSDEIVFANDNCDLSNATLSWNGDNYDRLHRFHRLKRILKWSLPDLDALLTAEAFGYAPADNNVIITNSLYPIISGINQLVERFRLAPKEIISWYEPLSNQIYGEDNSAFDEVFLNSAVNPDSATIASITDADANPLVLLDSGVLDSSSYVSSISYALGVNLTELQNLIESEIPKGLIFKGHWDASEEAFPGGGSANIGWFYRVSTGGTVDSQIFSKNDLIYATANSASTSTYLSNWSTDPVDVPTGQSTTEQYLADKTVLSHLYAVTQLAKALKLSIKEFIFLSKTFDPKPLSQVPGLIKPEDTLAFLHRYDSLIAKGFSLSDLEYLFTPYLEGINLEEPTASQETFLLETLRLLRDGLKEVIVEKGVDPDIDVSATPLITQLDIKRERLKAIFDLLFDRDVSSESLEIVLAGSGVDNANFATEYWSDLADNIGDVIAELIGTSSGEYMDPNTPVANTEGRLDVALSQFYDAFNEKAGLEDAVLSVLAEQMDSSQDLVKELVSLYIEYEVGSPSTLAPIIGLFTNPAFIFSSDYTDAYPEDQFVGDTEKISESHYIEHFKALIRLQKAIVVLDKLSLDETNLEDVLGGNAPVTWQNITQINAVGLIDSSFIKLVSASRLESAYESGEFSMMAFIGDVAGTTPNEEDLSLIAEQTGWNLDDLLFLDGLNGFDFANNGGHPDEEWLLKIENVISLTKKIGCSAERLFSWTEETNPQYPDLTSDQASEIGTSVRSTYTTESWQKVAVEARDKLRMKQRDALVAYLLSTTSHDSTNDLYQHYLLDVEMSPCFMTSRIKNAISSIQLWVQRIFMNLEEDISFGDADAAEWKWRKYYRVWEAARKVFLYPENWIEPELRDDKTALFSEMEDRLLQDEITDSNVETAYRDYLKKLDTISNMEIAGLYHEKDDDILHVFSRTKNAPHTYYYRTWKDEMTWSSWEEVGLDIEGDHLVPAVYNNRTIIFWPVFTETVPKEQQAITPKEGATPPSPVLQIQMAFSELSNGRWQPKKLSKRTVTTPARDRDSVYFQTVISDGELYVDIFSGARRKEGSFHLNSCTGELEYKIGTKNGPPRVHIVESEKPFVVQEREGMKLVESESNQDLVIYEGKKTLSDVIDANGDEITDLESVEETVYSKLLKAVPDPYKISYPSNERTALSNSIFFFEDRNRTFLIKPTDQLFDRKVLTSWKEEGPVRVPQFARVYTVDTGVPTEDLIDEAKRLLKTLSHTTLDYLASHDPGVDTGQFETSTDNFIDTTRSLELAGTRSASNSVLTDTRGNVDYNTLVNTYVNGISGSIRHYHNLILSSASSYSQSTLQALYNSRITSLNLSINSHADWQKGSTYQDITEAAFASAAIGANLLDIEEVSEDLDVQGEGVATLRRFQFYTFYHNHVCMMISQLNRYGIDGLLDPQPDSQYGTELIRQQGSGSFDFKATYSPEEELKTVIKVNGKFPEEGFDFDLESPFSIYNWEVFFHAPMAIADRLSQNQKFEDAQKWYHYVFDPTVSAEQDDTIKRFWKFRPFAEFHDNFTLDGLKNVLEFGDNDYSRQVEQWAKTPFQPHSIARLRLGAYMKNVAMKYLDNLIAWGDQLFRRDTIESITEATQLYILASEILGPKPTSISKADSEAISLSDYFNDPPLSQIEEIESEIGQPSTDASEKLITPEGGFSTLASLLYFGHAPNSKLLHYWETVADRLFKIRNCQNIQGVTRSLALFQPPIDPALLVKAAAAGLDLGTVLDGISGSTLPHYRFRVLIQKANELCGDVKSLGQSLLSALEKKDAEELALLRASQEVNLLKAVREVKKQSIEEGKESLASIQNSLEMAETRVEYYGSREFKNRHEKTQLKKMDKALNLQSKAQSTKVLASALAVAGNLEVGVSGIGAFLANNVLNGTAFYNAAIGASDAISMLSSIENSEASQAGIEGGYERRKDEWNFQLSLAEKEVEQLTKQITAAEIRLAISERELENHDIQMAQSDEAKEFMKNKYTNRDLYKWMITQISKIYFTSYQLAFDVARMAERAYGHELARENVNFIQFGHWDSLHKGLLAGERLQADLRRLEVSYLEQNKREFEITKHVPLSILSAEQLIELRENGSCDFFIPEVLYDLDHPGQYMRRIKSVRITIPGVTGPYTNVSAKLTLLSSRTRKNTSTSGGYAYDDNEGSGDDRFSYNVGGIQSIATSSAQNDSGTFELNFQDERYLPFEGAGAISNWRLELGSANFRAFDFDTISDVILHVSYMAREGGESFKTAVNSDLQTSLNMLGDWLVVNAQPLQRLFSLKTHFPNALYQLFQDVDGVNYKEASFEIMQEHFPHFTKLKELKLSGSVIVMVKFKDSNTTADLKVKLQYGSTPADLGTAVNITVPDPNLYPLPYGVISTNNELLVNNWRIEAFDSDGMSEPAQLDSSIVEDIYLVMNYTLNNPS